MAVRQYAVELPATVAVVGVAGAIGSAVARALTDRGVVVHGFDMAKPPGGTATEGYTVLDVDDPDSCVDEFDAHIAQLSPAGLVIASGLYPARSVQEETATGLLHLLEVNAVVPALLVRSFLRHTSHPAASAVVTSSLAAVRARVGTAAYSTSKAALERLLTSVVIESRDSGGRVNIVRPGYVSTGSEMNPIPESYDAKMKAQGSASTPADLVDAFLWLLSSGSQQVNGLGVDVDRGMHLGSSADRAWNG